MKIKPSILVLCLLVVFAGAAMAQTPDGDPPSEESVCDDYIGDGVLFGLCNAYCEAMDCDSRDRRANSRACERKFLKFSELAQEPPPCPSNFCPCDVEGSLFSTFNGTNQNLTTCVFEEAAPDFLVEVTDLGGNTAFAFIDSTGGPDMQELQCGVDGPNPEGPEPLTPEQANVCKGLLLAAVAECPCDDDPATAAPECMPPPAP